MDRGAWQSTVYEVSRVRHDWATNHAYTIYFCPFICWWAFKLFPHPGHYKHESVGISLKIARLYDNSALNFLRSTHIVFHNGCTVLHSHSHSPVCKDSSFSTFSLHLSSFYFFIFWQCVWLVAQSCPTLCNPMECSPPGSSVHGILQARILEGVVMSSSRGSSQPRDWTQVSCTADRFFTIWATILMNVKWDLILILIWNSQQLVILSLFSYACWAFVYLLWIKGYSSP